MSLFDSSRAGEGNDVSHAGFVRLAGSLSRRSTDARRVRKRRSLKRDRRGAAAVEFAFVAVPLFLFIFASIEMGRALMAVQSMEEAARAGCRVAVLKGATTSSVQTEVASIMNMAGIATYTTTITPTSFSSLDRWQPISVTVSASFDDMTWLPTPVYMSSVPFSSSCTLPKESPPGT